MKNPCEARKIKASQILHKIISTHLLIMKVDKAAREREDEIAVGKMKELE